MARKPNPRKLLDEVLILISRDIEEIDKLGAAGKLDSDTANCLTRYSDALLKIVKDSDNRADEERAKLANLSTDELKSIAKKYLENK